MKKIILTLILFGAVSLGIIHAQTFGEITGQPFTPGFNPSMQFFDMDSDNDQDVIIAGNNTVGSFDAFTELYENDGNGNFTLVTGTPFEGVGLGDISIGDIDGDHDPDILIIGKNAAQETSTKLYRNDENGNFSEMTGTSLSNISHGDVMLADLNNDGHTDILLSGSTTPAYPFSGLTEIYINDGTGTFSIDANANLIQTVANDVLVFDVDNDDDNDIIISGYTNNHFTKLYKNDGSGVFTEESTNFAAGGFLAHLDANNDNYQDVIIVGYSSTGSGARSELFLNDGTGNFTEVAGNSFPGTNNIASIVVADYNDDENMDVFILTDENFSALVGNTYINNGSGVFTEDTNDGIIGLRNSGAATADIDNDQKNEILIMGVVSFGDGPLIKLYEELPCIVDIPDANFKTFLIDHPDINTNGDTAISCDEAATFNGIMNMGNLNISNLNGIEAFTALTELKVNNNNLVSLNLASNAALEKVDIKENASLTSLNIAGLTNLFDLRTLNTALSTLDVSSNTALEILACDNMNLTSLNLSGLSNLTTMSCSGNQLTSLDLTGLSNLTAASCQENQLASLNLSGCTSLSTLHLHENQLTNIDFITANNPIKVLWVSNNPLNTLNLSSLTSLNRIVIEDNDILTDIDLSQNTALVDLICTKNNQLTTINLANTTNENFSKINIAENPNLTCIQVDDVAWSNNPANWDETLTNPSTGNFLFTFDAQASFSENCSLISSTNKTENPSLPVSIFPNPAKTQLTIHLDKVEISQIEIIDFSGKTVQTILQNTSTVDVSKLGDGLYFVRIKTDKGYYSTRFIKA